MSFSTILRCIAIIILSVPFIFPIYIVGFFSERISYRFLKIWFRMLFFIFGIKLEVLKMSEPENFILASNHRSYLDIPSIMLALDREVRFLAHHKLFSTPFIGWALILQKHPKVKERSVEIKKVKNAFEKYRGIVIFPEGARNSDKDIRNLLPFKKGVEFLSEFLKASVYPVAIVGTHKVMPKGTKIPKPGKIKVIIGEKIENPETKKVEEEVKKLIEEIIKKEKDLI